MLKTKDMIIDFPKTQKNTTQKHKGECWRADKKGSHNRAETLWKDGDYKQIKEGRHQDTCATHGQCW